MLGEGVDLWTRVKRDIKKAVDAVTDRRTVVDTDGGYVISRREESSPPRKMRYLKTGRFAPGSEIVTIKTPSGDVVLGVLSGPDDVGDSELTTLLAGKVDVSDFEAHTVSNALAHMFMQQDISALEASKVVGNRGYGGSLAFSTAGTRTHASTTLTLVDGVTYDIIAFGWTEGYGSYSATGTASMRTNIAGFVNGTPTVSFEGNVDGPKIAAGRRANVEGLGADITVSLESVWYSGGITTLYSHIIAIAIPV